MRYILPVDILPENYTNGININFSQLFRILFKNKMLVNKMLSGIHISYFIGNMTVWNEEVLHGAILRKVGKLTNVSIAYNDKVRLLSWLRKQIFVWKVSEKFRTDIIPSSESHRHHALGEIFSQSCSSNINQIVFIIFRLIWIQTDFRLVSNESKNYKYNLTSLWLHRIQKSFLCVWFLYSPFSTFSKQKFRW